jgi:DNA polymerase-3 subunit alpha
LPDLQSTWEEDAFDQMELLGFPLYSPFSITTEDETDAVMANDLYLYKDAVVWIKGYLIHNKRTTTSNNKKMFFGTFLDSEGQWLDTVHFPEIADRYQFRGKGIYKVKGKVVIDYDCITIEVQEMEKLGVIEDPRYSNLRAGEGIFNKKIQEATTLVNAQVLGLPKGRSHY